MVWSVACALWGLQLDNNHIFLLACLMTSTLLVGLPLAARNLLGVELTRSITPPYFAGTPFPIQLTVRKRRGWIPLWLVMIENEVEGSGVPNQPSFFRSPIEIVPAGKTITVNQRGLFFRRGNKTFIGITLSSSFPLGLFTHSRRLELPEELLVYPQLRPIPASLIPQRMVLRRSQVERVRPSGGQEDFFGLREFQPGDNPKWIHWKSSARLPDKFLLREREDETMKRVRVILDSRVVGTGFGSLPRFEKGIRIAASLVHQLVLNDFSVDLEIVGDEFQCISVSPRNRSLSPVFEALAVLAPSLPSGTDGDLTALRGDGVPTLLISPRELSPRKSLESILRWR